ncbi:hypothetical protein C8Q75DRAFT_810932 [Abortiporus biennis]|nr:hypothetical protein C8Q75DRAFT_810932 [Abortiporus biennis]
MQTQDQRQEQSPLSMFGAFLLPDFYVKFAHLSLSPGWSNDNSSRVRPSGFTRLHIQPYPSPAASFFRSQQALVYRADGVRPLNCGDVPRSERCIRIRRYTGVVAMIQPRSSSAQPSLYALDIRLDELYSLSPPISMFSLSPSSFPTPTFGGSAFLFDELPSEDLLFFIFLYFYTSQGSTWRSTTCFGKMKARMWVFLRITTTASIINIFSTVSTSHSAYLPPSYHSDAYPFGAR